MNRNAFPSMMRNRGFSLIEIMISGFILALGLLGLAGMQSMAVKSSVEIQQRNLANSLLIDITERMQLNQEWLSDANNNYAIASLSQASLAAPVCVGDAGTFTNCTGEDIKNNDLYEWKQKFLGAAINAGNDAQGGLIEADACIAVRSDAGSDGELVEIVISWFSTVQTQDAAANAAASDLVSTCGNASSSRRQVSIETYVSKSS